MKTIVTRVGETFEISLPSYLCAKWKITPSTAHVKQVGKPQIGAQPPQRAKDGERYVGRFAPTIVTFKAISAGRCTLRAAVYQLDETRAMGRETIHVVVKPKVSR